jgi:DNA-binding NarL/FixJ family response regulator
MLILSYKSKQEQTEGFRPLFDGNLYWTEPIFFCYSDFCRYALIAMTENFRKKSDLPHQTMRLSNREKEILVMLSKGHSNKEIAEELKLSIATIHSYLKNVYEKMHVHSRTQAVAKYLSIQSS